MGINDMELAMTTGPGAALRMRIELGPSIVGEPSWPDGIAVRTFTDDDAIALYALLAHGYRYGGGGAASGRPSSGTFSGRFRHAAPARSS
jgi:hypothetical protein